MEALCARIGPMLKYGPWETGHGGGQRPGHGRTLMESRAADRTDRKADQTSSVEQKISRKKQPSERTRNVLGTYWERTLRVTCDGVGMRPRRGGSKREEGGGGTSRRKDEARTPAKASQKHEHTFLLAIPIENVLERRLEEFP